MLTGGRRLARSASRRPPGCLPFLRLTALLGTVADFLTLTGEYANANFSKVRLRAVTIKTQTVAKPSYGRVNLWLVGSPGSEPGLAQSHNLEVGDYVKR